MNTFNYDKFFFQTLAGVRAEIIKGNLKDEEDIEDYINDQARYYVNVSTNEVIAQCITDDLPALWQKYGAPEDKKTLAYMVITEYMKGDELYELAKKDLTTIKTRIYAK